MKWLFYIFLADKPQELSWKQATHTPNYAQKLLLTDINDDYQSQSPSRIIITIELPLKQA